MPKFIIIFLIIEIILFPKALSEVNSQKLVLTEIIPTIYTNSMKWIGFSLSSPHVITKISWTYK